MVTQFQSVFHTFFTKDGDIIPEWLLQGLGNVLLHVLITVLVSLCVTAPR